jgi:phosphonoacetate hydrolase
VLDRGEAAQRFFLPPELIGDLVVLADRRTTLGRAVEWHDLRAVEAGLRSHGGLNERTVPFIVNRPLRSDYTAQLNAGTVNNYDLFDFLLNATED